MSSFVGSPSVVSVTSPGAFPYLRTFPLQHDALEASLEFTLVDRIFKPLDVCLTQAYDAVIAGNPATSIMQECQARKLLQEALDCGYEIADELYKLSSSATTADRAFSEIVARCPK